MLGSCWDPAQKEQGEGLRFVSSFSHLPSPLCFQQNAVAEIFEAVQGFYLLILLQEQQVLASVEHAGLVCAQQMGGFSQLQASWPQGTHSGQSFAPLPHQERRDRSPAMLDASGQPLDHSHTCFCSFLVFFFFFIHFFIIKLWQRSPR